MNLPLDTKALLGGISPQQFLDEYWQKQPLLIRNAIPNFQGLFGPETVRELAADEECESRLITQKNGEWDLQYGPLNPRDYPKKTPYTVLVQGVNQHFETADALLRAFSFIPYARLDDLMVSWATEGGGVGPHFDSYDVFLLQGMGQRRWKISAQRDLRLVEDAPLKILQHFQPTREWVLNPGDMLYLPPQYAHDGVALSDDCMTWSIGFRAPNARELTSAFLAWLDEKLNQDDGKNPLYSDPDLRASHKQPAQISKSMQEQVAGMLQCIQWAQRDVGDFLGQYLSEPKNNVFFDPPERALSASAFRKAAEKHGLGLDLRSQMLYTGGHFFLNGEIFIAPQADAKAFRRLANERSLLELDDLCAASWDLLNDWYAAGYIVLRKKAAK